MAENLTKTTITKATVAKSGAGLTWDDATMTWDMVGGTWDVPGQIRIKVDKNSVTITKVTKS